MSNRLATARDSRGCELRAVRASGSPIVTVRGFPSPAGPLSWRKPSRPAMERLARAMLCDGETLEPVSAGRAGDREDSPHVHTYRARRPRSV
ncbi:hypothetical protein SEA_MACGULLY_95 [Rhodococcus phage MacGully]|nr:hypothetical protein SEA_MACGULLY_95 [Rhodococcus phage MacGully]